MKNKVFGVVLAGGSGTRMGGTRPTQFQLIADRPILIRTLETFLRVPELQQVLLVTPAAWTEHNCKLIEQYLGPQSRIQLVEGGMDRSGSLMQAIFALDAAGVLDEDTILVTHDAVRPFVTVEMIEAGIALAKTGTPAMTVIPATDTIICSQDGKRIDQVPDRATMYQMQTPQTFGALMFRRCYEQLTAEERGTVTDASGVFLRTGIAVGMVPGDKTNIKITWPEDLIIAEQFCR
jgi:2-C-methyl-D-erythritol 4-phosphate cytidylyltransferase